MKKGRPVTKKGSAAAKHRAASRKEYQSLPVEKRSARVANRDKEAQRRADAKRLQKDKDGRTEYHKKQARARKGKVNPHKCASCGSTTNVQFHHQGKDQWLCAKCHGKRT